MSKSLITLPDLLSFFPVIDLPITFAEESAFEFSKLNKPLSGPAIAWICENLEEEEIDEMTEFIPCLQLNVDDDYYAIVLWKGALLKYEYILCTLSKRGELISKKVIGGTLFKNDKIVKSVATVDEDFVIHVMVGANHAKDTAYDPENSQSMSFEILSTGDIIFSLNEELFNE